MVSLAWVVCLFSDVYVHQVQNLFLEVLVGDVFHTKVLYDDYTDDNNVFRNSWKNLLPGIKAKELPRSNF